jgi:DNA topoisomerase-2
LFDSNGCIKKYENVQDILKEFFALRMEYYGKRKSYLEGMLTAESMKLDNIARFICEKIDGVIVIGQLLFGIVVLRCAFNCYFIENKPKKEIIQLLVRRGFESDPVKAWKESQKDLVSLFCVFEGCE